MHAIHEEACTDYDQISLASLQEVDADLQIPRSRVLALRTVRTPLVPISRLPNELLSAIFSIYVANPAQDESYCSVVVTITHVCRHWRHLALSSPTLWTQIPCHNPAAAQEFIARSEGMEVDIVSRTIHHSGLEAALAEIRRARHVDVRTHTAVIRRIQSSLSQRAPFLTYFSMEDYGGGGSSLPDDFLGGEAPQLRSLIIQDIGFNWSALRDNPVLRRLSHLHITSTPEDCRAGSECFLTLLARMPSLQTCRLSDCFMNGEDIPSTDSVTDILILPRLSKLALLGPMVAISGILHYLRVQPRAEVSLACTLAGSTGGMLSFFNHRLNDPNRPPCRYLEHRLVGNSFSMQMHANRTLLSAVDPEPLLDVRVMFREHHEAFMGLHNIVPLAEIHEWDLNVSASFGIHMLAAVFSRCENVVQLRLTNVSGIRQVFESYLAPFRSPNEHDKKTAFLPNLRSIRLSGRYPLEGETFWTVVPGVMTERHKLLGILPSITVEDPDGVREYALETLLAMAARVDIATAVDDILQV